MERREGVRVAQCVVCSTEIREDARFCPSCGAEQPRAASTDPSDDPFIGQVVNRNFRIESLLGVGGMGKVYKARQLSLDKTVVIKILHDKFRDDPQLVQRFQREAKAASRLNHPNSIQVIDFGQDEHNTLFMAQEFLEGVDLFTVLRREGPLPKERLARIMMQVCSALAEAHENNVIHRDLKPENIMVEDRRGQRDFVKVLDFGIAKIQDPDEKGQALTQAGMVCGTPEYMSPEQARGMALDARSDLYSVGVLVYQLATGELPFQADTPIGIVTKHILEQPVPPSQRVPGVSVDAGLERIILRAMVKDTAQRYQTAAEMASDFEGLLYAGVSTSPTEQPRAT
ncbi:MAG: serine/threonine-protein kinase, partial [Myxococcota bacterium]